MSRDVSDDYSPQSSTPWVPMESQLSSCLTGPAYLNEQLHQEAQILYVSTNSRSQNTIDGIKVYPIGFLVIMKLHFYRANKKRN